MNAMLALVDCTSFYVSCEKAFNVALREKPVVVLTNNDACIAALSKEAKVIGLQRGTPLFQCRDLIEQHQVVLLSSNYSLYHDMSARVMANLAAFSPHPLEVFSIDEAFLDVTHVTAENLAAYGRQIRATVLQRTGIPTVVSLASTKTLTKVAVEIAKARPEYRHVLAIACLAEEELDALLASLGVHEVWGIGPRYAAFLQAHGIYTARDLKYADQRWIRKHLTVVGHQTQLELQGVACLPLEPNVKPRKGIMRSRTFGRAIESLNELEEAVATYTARAAEQLRSQGSVASCISVFLQAPQYAHEATRTTLFPTAFTPDLIHDALEIVRSLYQHGLRYRKAGVFLSKITRQEVLQADLFGTFSLEDHHKKGRLMQVVDWVNKLWGTDTLFFGAQGITRGWQMKQLRRSPRYTTRWQEILQIT